MKSINDTNQNVLYIISYVETIDRCVRLKTNSNTHFAVKKNNYFSSIITVLTENSTTAHTPHI